jgi:hypothetical protein
VRSILVWLALSSSFLLGSCITSSMQGYADRAPPFQPIRHIAAMVSAPVAMAPGFQSSLSDEAAKRGVALDDALVLLPPTRSYKDDEIRRILTEAAVDSVLVVTVGDSGVQKEYAGTIFQGQYSGSSTYDGSITRTGTGANIQMSGNSSGSYVGSSTAIHRYSRVTHFDAKLIEVATGRTLWMGSGEVNAGGKLFVGNSASASSSAASIFNDLAAKRLLSPAA